MSSGSANKWPTIPTNNARRRRRRRRRCSSESDIAPLECRNNRCTHESRYLDDNSRRFNHMERVCYRRRWIQQRNTAWLLTCCCLVALACQVSQTIDASNGDSNQRHVAARQLFSSPNSMKPPTQQVAINQTTVGLQTQHSQSPASCSNGLLTFELSTGFIYKSTSPAEVLAMKPGTLQLTDCLDYCLQNSSCLAINFEMGLCVLLSTSAKQNPQNLYSSQFPVFTIYAEKKCLLQGEPRANLQRHRCAWTFERVAGYEMKTRPRRRLEVASKELCMESCLLEREFECRSANWYRLTNECTLSDLDRHSVSQSEAGDQQIKGSLSDFYGPSNLTAPSRLSSSASSSLRLPPGGSPTAASIGANSLTGGLYQNYYMAQDRLRSALAAQAAAAAAASAGTTGGHGGATLLANMTNSLDDGATRASNSSRLARALAAAAAATGGGAAAAKTTLQQKGVRDSGQLVDTSWPPAQYVVELPAQAPVDYLENNCVHEPNKLCEFRKIQNRVLKTVDSIYQDVNSLDECKQKCLNAPYRCYSFDYGDTSERVCRTSHLDQASLLSVKEPYLDVVGAITYELASCFNVTIACRAREMVAQVSSSKMFRGKIYVKSRPSSCVNDVRESLKFELSMRYHDENCDVRASSNTQQGVFSNDIVIQHHDRIVTTQDVGLSVYCQYDLGNRSITNNVDLAINRIDEAPMESKNQPGVAHRPGDGAGGLDGSINSPLTITSLATTVVRSPNVTMRITNMDGQPVASATVGDRLALLFEIKEKTSPFGIFVREIIAMDGKQLLAAAANNKNNNNNRRGSPPGAYHYAPSYNDSAGNLLSNESAVESMFQANKANSVQFIDADGCPTDANIMGPLVKMDATGHRVLAPFDAFKFPTSDMVFFRAVVTSCVSECKPVVCPPQSGGGASAAGDPFDSFPQQYTTTTELATTMQPTSAQTQFDQVITTSTTLGSTPAATTTTSGRRDTMPARQQAFGAPSTLPSTSITTYAASMATDSPVMLISNQFNESLAIGSTRRHWAHQSATSGGDTSAKMTTQMDLQRASGDSLTTVPGFGTTETPAWHAVDNGENSVKQGDAGGSGNKLSSNLIESLNLPQQRQQLVKLFENKLKQHLAAPMNHQGGTGASNATLAAEMAQLYGNFIASLMLTGNGSPQQLQQQQQTSSIIADQSAIYRSRSQDNNNSGAAEPTSGSGHTAEGGSATETRLPPLDSESFLLSYLMSNGALDDNDTDASANDSANGSTMDLLASPSGTDTPMRHKLGAKSSPQQPPPPVNRYRSQRVGAANKEQSKSTTGGRSRQQSALVEAPLVPPQGPYQSFGKRRRRRDLKDHYDRGGNDHLGTDPQTGQRSEESISSGYVRFVEQLQQAALAPSIEPAHYYNHNMNQSSPVPARFTRSTVEMYHTQLDDTLADGASRLRRTKRDTPQPFYELDELVVQSIKIVDRLHFQDEEQPQPKSGRRVGNGNSSSRSSIVTRSRASGTNLTSATSLEMIGDQPSDSLGDAAGSDAQEQSGGPTLLSWSSTGVLSLFIVAASFVFIQIFLVLVCLIEWNHQKRGKPAKNASLPAAARVSHPPSSAFSTLTNSSSSSSLHRDTTCYSTNDSFQHPLFYQTTGKRPVHKIASPITAYLDSPGGHTRAMGRRDVAAAAAKTVAAPSLDLTAETNHYYCASAASLCRSSLADSDLTSGKTRRHQRKHTDCSSAVIASRMPNINRL